MTDPKAFDKRSVKVEWIPVRQISVIWAEAQRPFDERHATNIKDNFDPDKFMLLAVTQPDGKGIYHCIDGQHRRRAVEMLWGPDERVPCEIYPALNPQRAAELFDAINSARKRPNSLELFLVRVTAGHQAENAVNKIVKDNGFHVGTKNAASKRAISCVAALLSVYNSHGPDALDRTLKVLPATWGFDPHAMEAQIVRGYGAFLAEHGHYCNLQRLKEVIVTKSKWTPGIFLSKAKAGQEMTGGTISNAIKQLLVTRYNRGLPPHKQLKTKSAVAEFDVDDDDVGVRHESRRSKQTTNGVPHQ